MLHVPDKYAVLLLFLLALLPRALAPGDFVTVDEAYHWFDRARQFLQAVEQGDHAGTNIIGHPGVTTMWLGALGILAHRLLADMGWISPADATLYRDMLRLPVTITTALCVALAYPLLRRLLDRRVAWLAGLLWASEPFLVAHSKILHLDALLTSFMTLALLAALVAFGLGDAPQRRFLHWPALVASGAAGGLALLTKSPSVLLLPMLGLVALAGWLLSVLRQRTTTLRMWLLAAGWAALALLVWAALAAAVWFALWPAAWAGPLDVVEDISNKVIHEGASPHGWGNFFLGQPVEDPGPLFYPVATAFRLTPWTMIGLLLAAGPLWPGNWRKRGYAVLLLLLCFVLLFAAALTFAPKKFDRYLLPVFPALTILAAAGWGAVWEQAKGRWQPAAAGQQRQAAVLSVAPFAAGLLLAANLAWYHPYEMAYYNPLLGGGPAAVRVIPVGWGEGMAEAGRYISAQLNGCDRPVASWFQPTLSPFVCSPVLHLREALKPGRVDYVVLYIDQIQRGNVPEVTAMLRPVAPVHTVQIQGIPYAAIYQLPLPLEHMGQAAFGSQIRLHSYELSQAALRSSGVLTLTVQWQALAPISTDYMLFAHIFDAQGQQVGQVDVPPGGPHAPSHAWNAGHYITWYHPLPVAADLPAGTYWLGLGLYDPQNFVRLPVQGPVQPAAPDDGPDVLFLQPLTIR